MDDMEAKRFVVEIRTQCQMALGAKSAVDYWLGRGDDVHELFRNLQSLLCHAASISKILWSGDRIGKRRSEELRTFLVVDDDYPVLASREVRNHFEHFDERLDEALSRTEGTQFVDLNIMSPGVISGIQEKVWRNLDPANWLVTFWDDSIDLMTLLVEIQTLMQAVNRGLAELYKRELGRR